jgi:hypothetical protein
MGVVCEGVDKDETSCHDTCFGPATDLIRWLKILKLRFKSKSNKFNNKIKSFDLRASLNIEDVV